jgi:hypothetical protein
MNRGLGWPALVAALAGTLVPLPARAAVTYERVGDPVKSAGYVSPSLTQGLSATADGRFVLYMRYEGSNAAGFETVVYLYDRTTRRSELVSVSSRGAKAGPGSRAVFSPGSISADGRFVVFCSWSANLVPHDTNGFVDVFLRDRKMHTTTRINLGPHGRQLPALDLTKVSVGEPGGAGDCQAAISADGSRVLWRTQQDVLGDGANTETFYSYSRVTHRIVPVDRRPGPVVGTVVGSAAQVWHGSSAMSADGRYVVFSTAARMLPADTDDDADVYRRDVVTGALTMVSDPHLVGSYEAPKSPLVPPPQTGASLPDSSAYRQATIDGTGRQVAFLGVDLRERAEVDSQYVGTARARIMHADLVARTVSVPVTRAQVGGYEVADGPRLLADPVIAADGRSIVYILPADRGDGLMTSAGAGADDSPDATYTSWSSLVRVPVAGGTPVVLTSPRYSTCPRWLPLCVRRDPTETTTRNLWGRVDIAAFVVTANGHGLLFWTGMPFVAEDTDADIDLYAWRG